MANRPQWNNVSAPNFSGINDLYLRSSGLIKDALGDFGNELQKLQVGLNNQDIKERSSAALSEYLSLQEESQRKQWLQNKGWLPYYTNKDGKQLPIPTNVYNLFEKGRKDLIETDTAKHNLNKSQYGFNRLIRDNAIADAGDKWFNRNIIEQNISDPTYIRSLVQDSNLTPEQKSYLLNKHQLTNVLAQETSLENSYPEASNVSLTDITSAPSYAAKVSNRIYRSLGYNPEVLNQVNANSIQDNYSQLAEKFRQAGYTSLSTKDVEDAINAIADKFNVSAKDAVIALMLDQESPTYRIYKDSSVSNVTPFTADTDIKLADGRVLSVNDARFRKALQQQQNFLTNNKNTTIALATQQKTLRDVGNIIKNKATSLIEKEIAINEKYKNVSDTNKEKRFVINQLNNEKASLSKKVQEYNNIIQNSDKMIDMFLNQNKKDKEKNKKENKNRSSEILEEFNSYRSF